MGKKFSWLAIGSFVFGILGLLADAFDNEVARQEMKAEIKKELADEIEQKYLTTTNEETDL